MKNDRKNQNTEIVLWRDATVEEIESSNGSNRFCEFEIRIKAIKK